MVGADPARVLLCPSAHTGKSCSLIPELPAGRAEVLFSGSADAVGKHRTQTFNFAVCSHRVSALDCARDIAKTREATP
jgi:hypothetical protein